MLICSYHMQWKCIYFFWLMPKGGEYVEDILHIIGGDLEISFNCVNYNMLIYSIYMQFILEISM